MTGVLDGQVIVVTGAAQGIGAAIARCAARAGATLLLTDRDADGLARTRADCQSRTGADHPEDADHPDRSDAATVVADLLDAASPAKIIAAAKAAFGRVDGLVNAAGITNRTTLASADLSDWDALMTINARAPLFLMQGAVADMVARGAPGAIVNILSVNAHCGAPDLAVYSGSKGALATLTKNVANAHKGTGIRANGINLGWAATEAEHVMQAETLGRGAGWLAQEAERMPLGRLLEADEVAPLAVHLLSAASAPMTGVCVDFDQNVLGAP